ncbi:hypothetical protein A5886_001056 [Enterococcus sp. 8G7_MSG3316]|uniref:ABC transporter domain-containing protein n=1 Tax=Candidatus Enterococcus testudinis TaxID=1834191 RepID=A0A242A508_9ENTE|nr:ATP-binding cassette domain-containing protein [Enterococcus sp. 8G7_MSG3316]OTN75980.1 hypothetical protein A5886_001056 [Enterococcus sp. 8G7_MSG3316]
MTLHVNIEKKLFHKQLRFDHGFTHLITGIQGVSGAGKTTILKVIAGLTQCDAGAIYFNETVWLDTKCCYHYPTQKRNVWFVMQQTALFPKMSVEENILFSQNMQWSKKRSPQVPPKQLSFFLDALEIAEYANESVERLSGGQQQRVALARALMSQPELLLLDEPFNGLDDVTHTKVMFFLKQFIEAQRIQTILVSHSKAELSFMTNEIVQI